MDFPERKDQPYGNSESETTTGFKGKCWYCEKKSHLASNCKKLKADMMKKRNAEQAKVAINEVNNSDTESFTSLSKLGF